MTLALLVVLLLVVLGVLDLIVGVSNDAVNFLNSAVGSKVANRRAILWVAAAGLLIGSFFSSGMMDLARSGVVNPQSFTYYDLIAVFAAAMFVHVVLIDLMNTYALPTSTTTSLILQLIGGALAVAFVKSGGANNANFGSYIDTNQVFLIMAGIFLSVFVAFIVGSVVQFVSRVIFTFNYRERFGWLFAFSGALAATVIFYLIIKKGIYTDMFDLGDWYRAMHAQLTQVLVSVFVLSFFVLLVATLLFNINVPRWVVFFGTFALAMSFSSNDLVNFIGVPLAAAESSWFLMGSDQNAATYTLDVLNGGVGHPFSPTVYMVVFFASAVVMVIPIFYSKKSQAVIDTEILLERQGVGYERFEPTHLSKSVVRHVVMMWQSVVGHIPTTVRGFLERRFDRSDVQPQTANSESASFDMVRASVNLTVASVMILLGTLFHVPMSTTFIVFMVSMGTSLADGAWGRGNAVYRLSGVFTILGSWFFVSCLALFGAFCLTLAIWYGGVAAMVLLMGVTVWALRKSNKVFAKRTAPNVEPNEQQPSDEHPASEWFREQGIDQFRRHLVEASKIYFLTVQGLIDENIDTLKQAKTKSSELIVHTRETRGQLFVNLKAISEQSLESGHHFIQALDYISELANSLMLVSETNLTHIDNNHKGFTDDQKAEMDQLLENVSNYFNLLIHIEKEQRFGAIDEAVAMQQLILHYMDDLRKNQVKRIRSGESKTRVSIVYMDLLAETKNILLYAINVVKSHRDFLKSL